MPSLLCATRYLVVIPVLGLALAAATFFVIGGSWLIALIVAAIALFIELRTWSARVAERMEHVERRERQA